MNEVERAEYATLFALFIDYHVDPHTYRDLKDLYRDYYLKFPEQWLESTVTDWEDQGFVDVSRTHSGTSALINRARYTSVLKKILSWLGGNSLSVDARKEEILSDAIPNSDVPMRNGWKWFTYQNDGLAAASESVVEVPAANRLVPINHNLPEYVEIKAGLAEVYEAVRSANDLENRDSILPSLDAANKLWEAVELRAIQVKIGIVMAVEDAYQALTGTAKAVATGLLIDSIKSFVKAKAGIDLDHL
ncbi:MAG: hypothetical protein K2X76_04045 [Sphingomonas sp.]|nr:hypothetical protein [Sphingomonas sp.]